MFLFKVGQSPVYLMPMSRKSIPLPITSIDYKAAVQAPAILNLTEKDFMHNLIIVLYTHNQRH